jgi:hypothetical protein
VLERDFSRHVEVIERGGEEAPHQPVPVEVDKLQLWHVGEGGGMPPVSWLFWSLRWWRKC